MNSTYLELGNKRNWMKSFHWFHSLEPEGFFNTIDLLEIDEMKDITAYLLHHPVNCYDLTKLFFLFINEIQEDRLPTEVINNQTNWEKAAIAGIELKKAAVDIGNRKLSGLIMNPNADQSKPVFVYMHGTRFKKSPAPSQLVEDLKEFAEDLTNLLRFDWTPAELVLLFVNLFLQSSKLLNYIEEIFLIMVSVWKEWIVIMPDYPGLGDDVDEDYPYMVADDFQLYLGKYIEAAVNNQDWISKKEWNQELCIGGYSQGGYVALVVASGLLGYGNLGDKLKWCWPAGGPYSLSKVMRQIMLANKPYFTLSFLPLTLEGYYEYYGKRSFLSPEIVFGEDGENIFYIINESSDSSEADQQLKQYTNGKMIPSLLLTEHFAELLGKDYSEVTDLLRENDAFRHCPDKLSFITTLFHHSKDNVVPYENAVIASEKLDIDIVDLKLLLLDDSSENKHLLGFVSYMAKILYI